MEVSRLTLINAEGVELVLANAAYPGEAQFTAGRIGIEQAVAIGRHSLRRVFDISEGLPDPFTSAVDPSIVGHLDQLAIQVLHKHKDYIHSGFTPDGRLTFFIEDEVPFSADLPAALRYASVLKQIRNPTNTADQTPVIKRIKEYGRPVVVMEMLYAGFNLVQINSILGRAAADGASPYRNTLNGDLSATLFQLRDQLKPSSNNAITAVPIQTVHTAMLQQFEQMRFFSPDELQEARRQLTRFERSSTRGRPITELAYLNSDRNTPEVELLNEIGQAYFRVVECEGGIVFGVNSSEFAQQRRAA